uniref:DegT/DnrJ/EryC1/StrS aminotransferase n=2 Tax=Cereibacter TaxID=1653176 RepID=A4WZ82_CERS5
MDIAGKPVALLPGLKMTVATEGVVAPIADGPEKAYEVGREGAGDIFPGRHGQALERARWRQILTIDSESHQIEGRILLNVMCHYFGDLADTEQNDVQSGTPHMLNPRPVGAPSSDITERIPVAWPALPRTDLLVPYLRQIDEARIYTNHGPLVDRFETRLAERLGFRKREVIACSTGTMALVGAIRAARNLSGCRGRLCLLPAYTFVATAGAALSCGYDCHLVDIDRRTWAIEPAALRQHPRLSEVGLVLPVAPYGRMIDLQGWQDFHDETGIPVVIDAAACLDRLMEPGISLPKTIPLAVSLHATKSFGCGEGGLVLSRDTTLLEETYKVFNNGFLGSRDAQTVGLNGKMSEYTAAVALAELDGFDEKSAQWSRVAAAYATAGNAIGARLWTAPETSGCYALIEASSPPQAAMIGARLITAGVDIRNWYGAGLSEHPAYAQLSRDPLSVCADVAGCVIGLPCFTDLTKADIGRIVAMLAV